MSELGDKLPQLGNRVYRRLGLVALLSIAGVAVAGQASGGEVAFDFLYEGDGPTLATIVFDDPGDTFVYTTESISSIAFFPAFLQTPTRDRQRGGQPAPPLSSFGGGPGSLVSGNISPGMYGLSDPVEPDSFQVGPGGVFSVASGSGLLSHATFGSNLDFLISFDEEMRFSIEQEINSGMLDSFDYVWWPEGAPDVLADVFLPGSWILQTPVPLDGDYDGDSDVDQDDYSVWSSEYGLSGGLADGNGDGLVSAADYTVWRDNYVDFASGATAIPESCTASLLLAAIVSNVVSASRLRRSGRGGDGAAGLVRHGA